jgi:Plasmid pRiA4b ORF-3-like protein
VAAPARGQRNSLGELHEILQNAFDWSGEHLHRFFAFALLPFETAAKRRILLMRLCQNYQVIDHHTALGLG